MSKNMLGIKRICLNCGAKFYDLNKTPIICPKCHTHFDPEEFSNTPKRPLTEPEIEDDNDEIDIEEDDTPKKDVALDQTDEDEEDDETKGLDLEVDQPSIIEDESDDEEHGDDSRDAIPEGFEEAGPDVDFEVDDAVAMPIGDEIDTDLDTEINLDDSDITGK